tara:strand:+ start:85 stop:621 length:537 start_codon:yes stop_codon:yes gene_type:complete
MFVRGCQVDAGELQQIARLVEMNRQQLTALGEQIEHLSSALVEHREIISALSSINTDKSDKMMIPLGSGTQLIVDNPNNPTVVIDIGSGIQAERPISEAIKILESRFTDIEELIKSLQTDFDEKEENVKQLASKFTAGAELLQTTEKEEIINDDEIEDKQTSSKKRKRNISGELTLDD